MSGWERVAQETRLRAEKEPGFCSEKGRGGSPAPTSAGGGARTAPVNQTSARHLAPRKRSVPMNSKEPQSIPVAVSPIAQVISSPPSLRTQRGPCAGYALDA